MINFDLRTKKEKKIFEVCLEKSLNLIREFQSYIAPYMEIYSENIHM